MDDSLDAETQTDDERLLDGEPPDPLIGQLLSERYLVEALLGSGGMGSVYRARHVHIHKTVAIKVLHQEMTQFQEAVARFEREAVASARIEHSNVAAATDFGRHVDGSFFLVLEYVEGRSLRSELDTLRVLPPARALHIARQISSALNAAHNLGIVHRDLKPENVMLIDRDEDQDFVKVLDFGIAKVAPDVADQPALTRLGAVFGTPSYMSPEQASGAVVDSRSDLYTLGILLYEMVAGQAPFEDEDQLAVLSSQIAKEPPPLPEHVHPLIVALVRALLAKVPGERIQTALEVQKRIDEIALAPGIATAPPVIASAGAAGIESSSPSIEIGPPTALAGPSYSITTSLPGVPEGPVSGEHPTMLAMTGPPAQSTLTVVARGPAANALTVESVRKNLEALWTTLEPQLLRPLKLGNFSFPAWGLLVAAAGLFILMLLLVSVLSAAFRSSPPAMVPVLASATQWATPSPAVSAPAGPGAKVVTADDLARIEGTPVYKRTLEDWMDLGRGNAAAGRSKESVVAYRAALQLDRAPRNDPQMLADLRLAAQSPEAYGLVINTCEGSRRGLGPFGYELLWDLYTDLQARPDQPGAAEAAFKKLVILSRRTPPALHIAIDLHNASRCETLKGLLDRATQYGDERSLGRLRQLEVTTGCGADKQQDCYACLRDDDALAGAIKAAASRVAPKMERGYR